MTSGDPASLSSAGVRSVAGLCPECMPEPCLWLNQRTEAAETLVFSIVLGERPGLRRLSVHTFMPEQVTSMQIWTWGLDSPGFLL